MRKFKGYAILAMTALLSVFMIACACEDDDCRDRNVYGTIAALQRPTVVFVAPFNLEIGVPINRSIAATFSEAMDPATIIPATFTVTGPGATPVFGVVTYDPISYIAVFDPNSDLLANTTYTATITTGAKNLAGVSLENPFVWTFTTGVTPDTTNPKLIMTTPRNLATEVPVNWAVLGAFSEAMDPFTITPAGRFTLRQGVLPGSTLVPGTVTYVGLIATFKPASPLLPSTTYTARILPTATDLAGNPLIAGLVPNPWTFTTGTAADTTRPTVISVVPPNLATNVSVNTHISALFSEAMDPSSITGTINPNVMGIVSYDPLTYVGTFIPNSPLAANTTYTVTILKEARDLAGNNMLNDYVWSFTTGVAVDIARPWVSATYPMNGHTWIPATNSITATFNEDMKLSSINDVNFTLNAPGPTPVSGVVTYNVLTKVATFNPDATLLPSTIYTARVSSGAQDLAGNTLLSPVPPAAPPPGQFVVNPWTFTTADAPVVGPLPIYLGAAANFAILSGSGISNIPTSAITGDIGVSPGPGTSITGFSSPLTCPEVTGIVYKVDASGPACAVTDPAGLTAAKAALTVAYSEAAGRSVPAPVTISGDQGGITLPPGVYKSTSSLSIASGNLTLNGGGDPNAVWIFQIASTLTTVGCGASVPCLTGGNVLLTNSADAANVFWQVGSSATIGDYTVFEGTILANIDISINTGAQITGRLLSGAQPSGAGAVTLISNTVVIP